MEKSFVIKGNVCQTKNPRELDLHENAYARKAYGMFVQALKKGAESSLVRWAVLKRGTNLTP